MESTDTVTKKLADAISTLGLAMNDMSADMRTLVQTQQQITNALVDRQQSRLRSSEATQEVNRVETVIRKPATVHEEDIKTVIKKSDPTMSESQLEGILGSIKHHADLSILALKESRGDAAPNLTWAKLKTETVPTMSGFEAVVKDKYSVRFDLCEASWASKHILSQKWDNKKHYRTRASDNRPAKRPRVENDRQAKRVPRLSSRMSESPTAGAPKVTQIGTQSGPGASSTLPEASSSIHSLSTFGPVDGTYMEQQQTHHSPLMYTTSNGHTLHDIECNSETFPDPQYQRSYPCSEFDPQCPRYPDMTVPPQTAGYSRLLQQPFSPFQQNLHSGMSRLQGQSSDPSPSTDGAQPRCNTNHVNSATHTAYSTPQPQYCRHNHILCLF
ncbi:hypothetical protein BJV82DRAFT_588225 [Fennellomyces sp. T-0311]|nr:hypothetical protein BJV82DRAFT_630108 [Fennellomyces sp. T-0311]KAI8138829.1 hypothetical protein BJV82DRAFT_628890 [Fennellomyces sp. T-0311]KAI8149482.1 hypothetical protein BJV82DRAFT_588225 [Fennellomyces sp. T-0311]